MLDEQGFIAIRTKVIDELAEIVRKRLRRETLDGVYCVFLVLAGGDDSWYGLLPRLTPVETRKLDYCRAAGLSADQYRWDPFNPPRIDWAGEPEWEALLDHDLPPGFVERAEAVAGFLETADDAPRPDDDPWMSTLDEFAADACRTLNAMKWQEFDVVEPFVFVAWSPSSHNDRLMQRSLWPDQFAELVAAGLVQP